MKDVVRRGTAVATPAARPLGPRRGRRASSPTAGTGTASAPATPRARSAGPAPCPRRRRSPTRSGSPSPRASTTRRACSPPTSTWPRTTSTWSSTWATTSTRTRARTDQVRKHVGEEIAIARRLPHPPRPVPVRPAPAGGARPLPLARDLGRPRGRQQLRRRRSRRRRTSTRPTFLARRANAYQAYYEMMPLRRRSLPRGPHMQLYRKASFGRLAEFLVLDTRQYRTDQPNGDRRSRPERGRARPEEHAARRRAGAAGSRPSLLDRRRPGTCWPSR